LIDENNTYFKKSIEIHKSWIEDYTKKLSDRFFKENSNDYDICKLFELNDLSGRYSQELVNDLFAKYEHDEPFIFSYRYDHKPLFKELNNELIYEKINRGKSVDYKDSKFNCLHKLYVEYSSACVLEILLKHVYGKEYNRKDDLFIEYYISEYQKMYNFIYQFLLHINKSHQNGRLELEDEIDNEKENFNMNEIKEKLKNVFNNLNNEIKSYEKITMKNDLTAILEKGLRGDIQPFTQSQYAKKIKKDLKKKNIPISEFSDVSTDDEESQKEEPKKEEEVSNGKESIPGNKIHPMLKWIGVGGIITLSLYSCYKYKIFDSISNYVLNIFFNKNEIDLKKNR
jgi:hypothetical protein